MKAIDITVYQQLPCRYFVSYGTNIVHARGQCTALFYVHKSKKDDDTESFVFLFYVSLIQTSLAHKNKKCITEHRIYHQMDTLGIVHLQGVKSCLFILYIKGVAIPCWLRFAGECTVELNLLLLQKGAVCPVITYCRPHLALLHSQNG